MKNKIKKITLSLLSLSTLFGSASAISACGNSNSSINFKKILGDYNFGISIPPTSTLNYVRSSRQLTQILPTLVQGLWKKGPKGALKNQLQLPSFKFLEIDEKVSLIPGQNQDVNLEKTGSHFELTDFGIFSANLTSGESSAFKRDANNRVHTFYGNLNGVQKWKGNVDDKYKRPIESRDYIDYIKYIIDISTGSDTLREIRELRIKGVEKLYQAQIKYQRKFGNNYQFPLGKDIYASDANLYLNNSFTQTSKLPIYNINFADPTKPKVYDIGIAKNLIDQTNQERQQIKAWKNQFWPHLSSSSEEDKFVDNIRMAAIEFLTQGMLTYSADSWQEEHKGLWSFYSDNQLNQFSINKNNIGKYSWTADVNNPNGIWKSSSKVSPMNAQEIKFRDENRKKHLLISFDDTQTLPPGSFFQFTEVLLPINKEFVDSIGGIYNFGRTMKEFIYSSPFDITDIRLGQGGFISLEKDNSWFSKETVIPNKVKIYFQSDPNIISVMFQDGYISGARVENVYQKLFWSQKDLRQFMKKEVGSGTISLQLNIDYNKNLALNNEYLRKAISHAINRDSLLKLMNKEASFPVSTWTPTDRIKTWDGRYIDLFFDSETFKPEFSNELLPISSIPWSSHINKYNVFENVDRNDPKFNPDLARKYFNEYKKQTGNSEVTLQFLAGDLSTEQAGKGIKSLLRDIFNGQIKIEIKKLPLTSYQTFIKEGKFDLTINNFDIFGSQVDSYMKHLLFPDVVDQSRNKVNGYDDNPTGGWTFHSWFTAKFGEIDPAVNVSTPDLLYSYLKQKHPEIENFAKNELNIKINQTIPFDILSIWKNVLYLMSIPDFEVQNGTYTINQNLQNTFNNIFSLNELAINSDEKLFKFVAILEKIIAISAPIIPLAEADNGWTITRLNGIIDLYSINLEFGYDVLYKPRPSLPGKEELVI